MKAVILLSGGMDSATLLAHLIDKGVDVVALSFDYGQRHSKELEAAVNIVAHYSVPHIILDVKSLFPVFQGSALTSPDIDVPEGHYEDESMRLTVVPNRNMTLLSLAAAFAISHGRDTVAYAAHSGDHAIYPDCRQAFVIAMRNVLKLVHFTPIELYAPFVAKSKADIVRMGRDLKVPYYKTWSCYKGARLHCGKCGTCVERLEAFNLIGEVDPVVYDADVAPFV